jgi:hypothetical protein
MIDDGRSDERTTIETVRLLDEDGVSDQVTIEQRWVKYLGEWFKGTRSVWLKSTGEALYQVDESTFLTLQGKKLQRTVE